MAMAWQHFFFLAGLRLLEHLLSGTLLAAGHLLSLKEVAKHRLALKSFRLERHVICTHVSLAKVSCVAKTDLKGLGHQWPIKQSTLVRPSGHHTLDSLYHPHEEPIHLEVSSPKSHPATVQAQGPRLLCDTEISLLRKKRELAHCNSEIYKPIRWAPFHPEAQHTMVKRVEAITVRHFYSEGTRLGDTCQSQLCRFRRHSGHTLWGVISWSWGMLFD